VPAVPRLDSVGLLQLHCFRCRHVCFTGRVSRLANFHEYPTNHLLSRWLTRAQSLAECESKAIVCREPKLAAVYNALPNSRSVMPPEISLKNPTECVACGGVPVSYFSWAGGQWLPATFQPFEWRQREFVRSNLYVAIPSYDYFFEVLSASLARRYAKSLESDLWCR
jgi:ferredoxin